MRLGVISDTHDKLPIIDVVLDFFIEQRVDIVIHCGDWKSLETVEYIAKQSAMRHLPVRGVLGNNDHEVAAFLDYAASAPGDFELREGVLELQVKGQRIGIYHGHHAPTLRRVLADDYDILCLGHTHKPRISQEGETLVINPGSTAFSIPRSKDWQPTIAIVDTDNKSAKLHVLK